MTGSTRTSEGWQEVPGLAGVAAGGDDALDRIARLVSRVVGSDVALVSLVDEHRQFFAGQHGLDAPWRDTRATPLSLSICRLVVASGDVVQIDDTAADDRTAEHEARTILAVGSYLGVPLTDEAGNVLGSLCAINHHPHAWTGDERDLLVDLSAAANSELRGRIAVSRAFDATRRVQLAADASEVLSRSLDIEASLEAMLDVVPAGLASACLLYLPEGPSRPRRLLWRSGQGSSRELDAPRRGPGTASRLRAGYCGTFRRQLPPTLGRRPAERPAREGPGGPGGRVALAQGGARGVAPRARRVFTFRRSGRDIAGRPGPPGRRNPA